MIKVCGTLKGTSVKETKNGQVVKLVVVDAAGGDYAPTHYVDDWACRNWQQLVGKVVEIPARISVNGTFLNLIVLDSVQVNDCGNLKAVAA